VCAVAFTLTFDPLFSASSADACSGLHLDFDSLRLVGERHARALTFTLTLTPFSAGCECHARALIFTFDFGPSFWCG
jgi:hypothetical protein